MSFYYLPINPEPWAIGPLQIGKKNGKFFPSVGRNQQLAAFKEAVAAELEGQAKLEADSYEVWFYFWRRLDSYETSSGKRHRKHHSDTTNMQKATEDALQDVLFGNDRDVKIVRSEVVEQGPDVKPGIGIFMRAAEGPFVLPNAILELRAYADMRTAESDNTWPPRSLG